MRLESGGSDNDSSVNLTLSQVRSCPFQEPEQRHRRGGPKVKTAAQKVARFWARVQIGSPDACWLWTGARYKSGYGMVAIGPQLPGYTHRVAYELARGPIPDGRVVMHTCDTPLCCNPAHLHVGTHRDNMQDAMNKGRMWTGPRPGGRRARKFLTPDEREQIRTMRRAGVTADAIAAQFNLSKWHVVKIGTGAHKTVLELARELSARKRTA